MNKAIFLISLLGTLLIPEIVLPTCFYRSEVISGLNKICYYDCISGTVAITVDGTDLCPLSFQED